MEVSVISAVYRVEKYLRQCVESVLSQTFTDWELILVDDGSPDGCPKICDEYAAGDSRIKVVHQNNAGLPAARHAGMAKSTGRYVYFLDSDDYLVDNDVFQRLSDFAQESHYPDIIFFRYIKEFEGSGRRQAFETALRSKEEGESQEHFLKELCETGAYNILGCTRWVKRMFLEENKIVFPLQTPGEDNYWNYLIMESAESSDAIDLPVFIYRQRAGSITHPTHRSIKPQERWLEILEEWEERTRPVTDYRKKMIRLSLMKQFINLVGSYAGCEGERKVLKKRIMGLYGRLGDVRGEVCTNRVRIISWLLGLGGTGAVVGPIRLGNMLRGLRQ